VKIWPSIVIGLVLGLIAGAVVCGIALDHNPQGEFADAGNGRYTDDLYALFGITAAMVAVPVATLLTVIGFLRRRTD
jgi:cytochrome bd-type quinol oxidase subunit 2